MEKRPHYILDQPIVNEEPILLKEEVKIVMSTYLYPRTVVSVIKKPKQNGLTARTIWEYKNKNSGLTMWAVFYTEEHDMDTSPAVSFPLLLWEHGEITQAGKEFLFKWDK